MQVIAQAPKELIERRDRWLNAEGLSEAEKKKRILTNLYNARPTWLDLAHTRLDEAVFAAGASLLVAIMLLFEQFLGLTFQLLEGVY